MKKIILTSLFGLFFSLFGFSQSIEGTWKTVNDKTKKVDSYVEIFKKSDGKIYGKIVKIFDPEDAKSLCVDCPGDYNNKPVLGLDIMRGFVKNGKKWEGKILDPDEETIYSCNLKLDGKDKLAVRGYIGISLIGRSQTWHRVK